MILFRVSGLIVLAGYLSLLCAGCADPNAAARDVGRPIGGALGVVQSIPEGIAEGYAGGTSQRNPYGR